MGQSVGIHSFANAVGMGSRKQVVVFALVNNLILRDTVMHVLVFCKLVDCHVQKGYGTVCFLFMC